MKKTGTIYFVAAGPFVKIGWTAGKVRVRLSSISSSCPFDLRLLGIRPGSKEVERCFHDLFRAHHVRGEWFSLTEEICAYIETKCLGRSKIHHQEAHQSVLVAA